MAESGNRLNLWRKLAGSGVADKQSAEQPSVPQQSAPPPPAPPASFSNELNDQMHIANNALKTIESAVAKVANLQTQLDNLKAKDAGPGEWQSVANQLEECAKQLKNALNAVNEIELPQDGTPEHDDVVKIIHEVQTNATHMIDALKNPQDGGLIKQVLDIAKGATQPQSLAAGATQHPSSTAPVGSPAARTPQKNTQVGTPVPGTPPATLRIPVVYGNTPQKNNPLDPITPEQQAQYIREFTVKEAEVGLWSILAEIQTKITPLSAEPIAPRAPGPQNFLSAIQNKIRLSSAPVAQKVDELPQPPPASYATVPAVSPEENALAKIASEIRETLLRGNPNAILGLYDRIERTQKISP